jgi:hypothetical protein
MGDILKKITELIADGANYEERRSKGIVVANWFDAIDCKNGVALPGGGETKKTNCTTDQKRVWQTINDIP